MTSLRIGRTMIGAILACLIAAPVYAGDQTTPWPMVKHFGEDQIGRIALPLGGIGTGTISLGGRGDLRDWEIVNRPAKGFTPGPPFFALWARTAQGKSYARALQGPVEFYDYEGGSGARSALGPGLPRFRHCTFDGSYPFGQVNLWDRDLPVRVVLRAFNPMIPTDPEASGIPIAILRYEVTNTTPGPVEVSVCGSLPNFVGNDGSATLANGNRNVYRHDAGLQGIFMVSDSVAKDAEQWGSIALSTPDEGSITYRTSWVAERWGTALLDFWDDLTDDGRIAERTSTSRTPWGSLAVGKSIPPGGSRTFTFYLTWNFPNRLAWSKKVVGNYYSTLYADAWDVAARTLPRLPQLEKETVRFVGAFCRSGLPQVVKEAALFNLSTLRTQTCFRTADGRFFGWEGCSDNTGCCWGSCTHVWNYEQATAFLYGSLARSMRETEFGRQTDSTGLMSFRVRLPLDEQPWGKAAADGQMGSIMRIYRDWQLSGDPAFLKNLWPHVRRSVEFCWIPGGWDADKNGVMEGCQHNTMDVEYYGPNAQMQIWYLGALAAAGRMAHHEGDTAFASTCRSLFSNGSRWTDEHLFNGRYYIQLIQPPLDSSRVAPSLIVGMGATDFKNPDYQLGKACLVDQLVGQFLAHVCGLGYLVKPENVRTTLASIMKYNYRPSLQAHFNCLRTFALGDESALLMASYPDGRPENPFPYFTEVMTGFEYTAAAGMLYEGERENGLRCIASIRSRYDGRKRSPYDEAECGHHYGRAMASWGAVLAWTGFHYSGVDQTLALKPADGEQFWSNGYAYGTVTQHHKGKKRVATISSLKGSLSFGKFTLTGFGEVSFTTPLTVVEGKPSTVVVNKYR
jgi:non-lysosomal glucosylceramidase